MRLISFALTTEQIRTCRKTVTRRLGWRTLKPGTLLQPIEKAQGLKKGEHVQRIGGPIKVIDVRRERLDRLVTDAPYGYSELRKEGFPLGMVSPVQFQDWFEKSHRYQPDGMITRIEFEYVS